MNDLFNYLDINEYDEFGHLSLDLNDDLYNYQEFPFSDNDNSFFKYKNNNSNNIDIYETGITQKMKDSSSNLTLNSVNKINNIPIKPKDKDSDIFDKEDDNIPEQENKEEKKSNEELKSKNLLGIKRENSNKNNDNKYSQVNILRRIRISLVQNVMDLINTIIYKNFNGNIKQGIFKKKLLRISLNNIKTVKDNREFLYKNLREILSFDINSKFTLFPKEHNKNLINELLNENDLEKRLQYEKIFGLTFLDCLEHFRGSIYIKELEGLDTLDKFCKNLNEDKDYIKLFKYYVNNMKDIIFRKKERNAKNNS